MGDFESGPYGLEARRRASHQATCGFASYTVQVPALTFSYCCSPIPFVVLLLVLNKNNKKMVERSASLLLHVSTPCPAGENGHRRYRAVVEPTSHGLRRGRGRAARHRVAISTSGDHRAAAAEGASRGENRPFGPSRANEWLPMPTATSPMGIVRSRTV